MTLVSDLDLPVFGYAAPGAGRCHEHLAETRQQGWLAKSPLALDWPPAIRRGGGQLRNRQAPDHPIRPGVAKDVT